MFYANDEHRDNKVVLYCIRSSRQRLAAVLFIVFVSLCPGVLTSSRHRLAAVLLIVFVSLCAGSVPAAENLYDRQAYGWLRFR